MPGGEILTIGHSTHAIEHFMRLLETHRIEALADVRRYPGSRRSPQFGAEALAAALRDAGITYASYAAELGGRRRTRGDSPNAGWRSPSFRAYADHMASAEFEVGLQRLLDQTRSARVAIMCAEAHPSRCHRQLIADALLARRRRVLHILGDGQLVEHVLTPFAVVDGERVSYPPPQESLLG